MLNAKPSLQTFDTNSMVEEWMLAANCATAKHTYKQFPECAVLRRHPEPPPSNFEPLILAGKQVGHEIKVGSAKELQVSLDAAVSPDNPYFNTMLRMIATRCMMQAVYFATGTIEEPLFVHYGLAAPFYTHFTSPIRRYADIMVHRLLAASIGELNIVFNVIQCILSSYAFIMFSKNVYLSIAPLIPLIIYLQA